MSRLHHVLCLILLTMAIFANSIPVHALTACAHAPRPRLAVGMRAIVAEGVGPLNVRAFPAVSTGIQDQLYTGNQVTVLSGPSCNGLFNWWRVETGANVRGWVAEGTWEEYWLIPLRDVEQGLTTPNPFVWSCPRWLPTPCFEP